MEKTVDFQEIENVLEKIMGDHAGFEGMVEQLVENGEIWSPGKWIGMLGKVLAGQLRSQGEMIGYLLLLLISAAVLSAIAKAFRNRQISDMGFYMIYLLLFLIMMRSFGTCYVITENVLRDLVDFMRALMPAYLMAAAVGIYRTSAVLYYEGFLLMIYYLQRFVEMLLLPAIRGYVLFAMLGHLGNEEFFGRSREGLKKAIIFSLKTMVGLVTGMQIIQGMISPAVDEWKHTVVSKGISGLGSIGNAMGNLTDVVLGSGTLLKNGIGAAGAVLIIGICAVPVVQVGCYVLFYHVLAAVSEPISDKRLINAIGQMGDGIGLLVRLLFSVCVMFLLTIAVVCATTGGIR